MVMGVSMFCKTIKRNLQYFTAGFFNLSSPYHETKKGTKWLLEGRLRCYSGEVLFQLKNTVATIRNRNINNLHLCLHHPLVAAIFNTAHFRKR